MRHGIAAVFCLVVLFGGAWAVAQDRSLTVLEVSVVPTGGDLTFASPYDVGCDVTTRIAPVADQKPSNPQRFPKALCDSLNVSMLKAAKIDQSVGSGAKP